MAIFHLGGICMVLFKVVKVSRFFLFILFCLGSYNIAQAQDPAPTPCADQGITKVCTILENSYGCRCNNGTGDNPKWEWSDVYNAKDDVNNGLNCIAETYCQWVKLKGMRDIKTVSERCAAPGAHCWINQCDRTDKITTIYTAPPGKAVTTWVVTCTDKNE